MECSTYHVEGRVREVRRKQLVQELTNQLYPDLAAVAVLEASPRNLSNRSKRASNMQ
jgi:broad-specificity NMP kinase